MRTGDRVLTYIVDRELGEGGMGSVYLARHTVLDQQVAIKVLSPLLSRDHAVRERFIQEANIQAALRHPGIVQVLNAGYEGEQPVLVMEYIEGNSLFEVLERRGALPLDDALKIIVQVFSAVGYAHRQGVIHRDLKPENIMVTAVGDVKVTDFGIAKILGSARLTRTGTVMGSAYYMSTEQIMNPESVDTRSDIYSLGCLFYELLTGHPPFGEKHASGTDNDFRVKSAHVNQAVPELKANVPEWLTQLIMSMLEKAPDQRPPSCEAILSSIKDNSSMKDALNEINSDKNKQSRETQEMGENISYTHGTETQNQLALDYQSKKRVEARLQAEEFVRNQEKYQKQKQKVREEKIKLFEEKHRADKTLAWISMLAIIFFTFFYFLSTKTPLQTTQATEHRTENSTEKTISTTLEIVVKNPYNLKPCPEGLSIWRHDCWGTVVFGNGDRYVGEFKNDHINGVGNYVFYNNEMYSGSFSEGKFNGRGFIYSSDGSVKESGVYEKGVLVNRY